MPRTSAAHLHPRRGSATALSLARRRSGRARCQWPRRSIPTSHCAGARRWDWSSTARVRAGCRILTRSAAHARCPVGRLPPRASHSILRAASCLSHRHEHPRGPRRQRRAHPKECVFHRCEHCCRALSCCPRSTSRIRPFPVQPEPHLRRAATLSTRVERTPSSGLRCCRASSTVSSRT